MTKSPSEKLHEAISSAVAEQVKKLILEADWDFVEQISKPTFQYIENCRLDEERRGYSSFYPAIDGGGAVMLYEISDEFEPILSQSQSLFDIYDTQCTDCERSQADLIFALEDTVNKLKTSFEKRFGVPCEAKAIEANVRKKFPDITYDRPASREAAKKESTNV